MSFTGQLGTASSYLSNIELGIGVPGNTYGNSLTIAGISAIRSTFIWSGGSSVTIAGIAGVSRALSLTLHLTLTVAADAALNTSFNLSNSLDINGISALTITPNLVIDCSLSINGKAAASTTDKEIFHKNITIAGISSYTNTTNANELITLHSKASATVSANFDYISLLNLHSIGSFVTYANTNPHIFINGASGLQLGSYNSEAASGISALTVASNVVLHLTVSQTLVFTHNEVVVLHSIINQSQRLSFNQSIHVTRIHNKTISQSLSLTQNNIGFFDLPQRFIPAQTVASLKINNLVLNQHLTMISSPTRNIVSKHNIQQTLHFNPIKLITSQIQTTNGRFVYTKPVVIVTQISKGMKCNCSVILTSNNQVIVLPCPQFNDGQDYSGTINLKRMMNGDTYTYIRRSTLNKLKYTFFLGREKGLELRNFFYNNSDSVIQLSNWKGEIWYVVLTNNPFEFVISQRYQREQERADITLEFEGVKLT